MQIHAINREIEKCRAPKRGQSPTQDTKEAEPKEAENQRENKIAQKTDGNLSEVFGYSITRAMRTGANLI